MASAQNASEKEPMLPLDNATSTVRWLLATRDNLTKALPTPGGNHRSRTGAISSAEKLQPFCHRLCFLGQHFDKIVLFPRVIFEIE